jgi:hypothetical protein
MLLLIQHGASTRLLCVRMLYNSFWLSMQEDCLEFNVAQNRFSNQIAIGCFLPAAQLCLHDLRNPPEEIMLAGKRLCALLRRGASTRVSGPRGSKDLARGRGAPYRLRLFTLDFLGSRNSDCARGPLEEDQSRFDLMVSITSVTVSASASSS